MFNSKCQRKRKRQERRFSDEVWGKEKKPLYSDLARWGPLLLSGGTLEKTKWVRENLSGGGAGAQLCISAVHQQLVAKPQCSQTSLLVSHLPILWLPHYFFDYLLLCSFQWEGNAKMETMIISDILYFFARHSSGNKLLEKPPLYARDLEFHS